MREYFALLCQRGVILYRQGCARPRSCVSQTPAMMLLKVLTCNAAMQLQHRLRVALNGKRDSHVRVMIHQKRYKLDKVEHW